MILGCYIFLHCSSLPVGIPDCQSLEIGWSPLILWSSRNCGSFFPKKCMDHWWLCWNGDKGAASIESVGTQVSIIAYGKTPSMACKLTAGWRQWGWFVLDRAEQIWWPMSYMTIFVLDKSSSGTVTHLDIIACKSRDSLNDTGGLPQHMSTIRKTIPGASFLRDSLTICVKKLL